jgi:hypothetical protein
VTDVGVEVKGGKGEDGIGILEDVGAVVGVDPVDAVGRKVGVGEDTEKGGGIFGGVSVVLSALVIDQR